MPEPGMYSSSLAAPATHGSPTEPYTDTELLTLTPLELYNRSHAHFVANNPLANLKGKESSDDLKSKAASLHLIAASRTDDASNGDGYTNRPRLPSNLSVAQCRICFSASGDVLTNGGVPTLIHPCACDGSIRFCHPECLLQWVRQSGSFVCELCKTRYRIRRSGLKSIRQWRMPSTDSIDWIHLVIFFFSVCFIVGSIIWMTWLGLGQRMSPAESTPYNQAVRHEESSGTLGDFMIPAFILYSIIDILFLFIAGMELIFTISPLARKWYRMNQNLVVESHNTDRGSLAPPPRLISAHVIPATVNSDRSAPVNLQAAIPCVSEERDHERALQDNLL